MKNSLTPKTQAEEAAAAIMATMLKRSNMDESTIAQLDSMPLVFEALTVCASYCGLADYLGALVENGTLSEERMVEETMKASAPYHKMVADIMGFKAS